LLQELPISRPKKVPHVAPHSPRVSNPDSGEGALLVSNRLLRKIRGGMMFAPRGVYARRRMYST
jgi:hypothetical protein